jgi:hypothetical protein
MTEIVAGYKVQRLDDGVTELLEPAPSWAAGAFGVFWGGLGLFGILTPSGWEAGWATPVFLFALWVVPGARLVIPCLRRLIFRGSWLLRGGEIARRRRIRGLGLVLDGRFQAVRHVELRHGIWKTGTGSTDIFRLYLFEESPAITLATRERRSREVDPEIHAFGELVASRVGRKVSVLTETIKEPSRD